MHLFRKQRKSDVTLQLIMETIGNLDTTKRDTKSTYRIEHLPNLDVIENLNYPEKKDRDDILELLRNNPLGKNLGFDGLSKKIANLKQGDNKSFFVKMKSNPTIMVDYILDRNGRSHTAFESAEDSNFKQKRTQYTRAGVLSEIVISPRIKDIVGSTEVQELARKYGFDSIKFAEPIFALTFKETAKKALIYKNIKWRVGTTGDDFMNLAKDLRRIFLQNGIYSNDLHSNQFMTTEQNGKSCVVLIDVESYVEVTP